MTTAAPDRFPCSASPELFHAPDGQHSHTAPYKRRVAAAKAICARCPVRLACRDEGRELHATGIWGGEDDEERTKAGAKPRKTRVPAPCGTEGGAKRHRRYKQIVCAPCLEAESAANRERVAKRAARAEGPKCGSRPGYQRHRRNDEPACEPCKAANAAADRRLHDTGTTLQLAS